MKHTDLIELDRNTNPPCNRVLAVACRWCLNDGEPHSPACPAGERYKWFQSHPGTIHAKYINHGETPAEWAVK